MVESFLRGLDVTLLNTTSSNARSMEMTLSELSNCTTANVMCKPRSTSWLCSLGFPLQNQHVGLSSFYATRIDMQWPMERQGNRIAWAL